MHNKESLSYWAVLEHHRHWLGSDGPFHAEAKINELTLVIARKIARDYGVARTIGAVGDEKGIGLLIKDINAITDQKWDVSLTERADICLNIAKAHQKKVKKGGMPISAVTKLMWFRRPEGWTMFDRYARLGLIGKKNNAMAFYRVLQKLDFVKRAEKLTSICRTQGFDLWGERIIDKLLLFRGIEFERSNEKVLVNPTMKPVDSYFELSCIMNRRHLEILPLDYRKRLDSLAREIAAKLPDDGFCATQATMKKCA